MTQPTQTLASLVRAMAEHARRTTPRPDDTTPDVNPAPAPPASTGDTGQPAGEVRP